MNYTASRINMTCLITLRSHTSSLWFIWWVWPLASTRVHSGLFCGVWPFASTRVHSGLFGGFDPWQAHEFTLVYLVGFNSWRAHEFTLVYMVGLTLGKHTSSLWFIWWGLCCSSCLFFCVVFSFFALFVFVLCLVSNITGVSWLSILDCTSGFP